MKDRPPILSLRSYSKILGSYRAEDFVFYKLSKTNKGFLDIKCLVSYGQDNLFRAIPCIDSS